MHILPPPYHKLLLRNSALYLELIDYFIVFPMETMEDNLFSCYENEK
ncbi:hypothetical protein [Methanocaldococcus lauensis]|nr:hypothetical protein [Methanocaldococcus lauensis]